MHFFSLFLVLIVSSSICAQQTANYVNNWHFGTSSGITFNSGSPVNIPSAIVSNEAMSNRSDGNGNTLFYNTAFDIWDATNVIMPNGNGITGDPSSSCGSVSCPIPGNCDQYYVFYTSNHGFGWGLAYSIVDMSLPGNGTVINPLGDVVSGQKNIMHYSGDNLAEKVIAIQKGNTENYWIVMRSITVDVFYSFEVSATGINPVPVISTISGAPFTGVVPSPLLGWLAINPDRNLLAEANGIYSDVKIFDFDNTTGIVSNEEVIMTGLVFPNDIPYGVAFSGSGDYLYAGWSGCCPTTKNFSSFDVTGGIGTIAATRTDHDITAQLSGSTDVPRALVRGIDGKIYFAWGGTTVNNNQLGVINAPENTVTPNIVASAHTVTNTADLGLPNIFYYYHPDNFIDTLAGHDRDICPTEQATIGVASYDSIWATYSWEPAAMVISPGNAVTQTVPLAASQQFVLTTISPCGDTITTDTTLVTVDCTILPVELGDYSIECDRNAPIIRWTTLSERHTSYFEIQGSPDGINFSTIGLINAAGESSSSIDYSYELSPSRQKYYRVKQVDQDGQFEYFDTKFVDCKTQDLMLYPNPSNLTINITGAEDRIINLKIMSINGKVVEHQNVHPTYEIHDFSIESLASGMYIVEVQFLSGRKQSLPFVK